MIDELNLNEVIRWLPAANSPAEMSQRYRLSSVVVSVASSDGAAVSVIEAMACGRPVICSDLPALREFVTPGENGWLVPVRQPAPLADAILHVLGNTPQAEKNGQRAHRDVAKTLGLDVQMQRMEAIYYQLARKRRG